MSWYDCMSTFIRPERGDSGHPPTPKLAAGLVDPDPEYTKRISTPWILF